MTAPSCNCPCHWLVLGGPQKPKAVWRTLHLCCSTWNLLDGCRTLVKSRIVKCRRPTDSVNFVIAHDGFTLCDLVSYNEKHNDANGEGNRYLSPQSLHWHLLTNTGVCMPHWCRQPSQGAQYAFLLCRHFKVAWLLHSNTSKLSMSVRCT